MLLAAGGRGYFVWTTSARQGRQPVARARADAGADRRLSLVPRSRRGRPTTRRARSAFETSGRLAELLPAGTEVVGRRVARASCRARRDSKTLLAHDLLARRVLQAAARQHARRGQPPRSSPGRAALGEKRRLVDETHGGAGEPDGCARPSRAQLVETLAKIGTPVAPRDADRAAQGARACTALHAGREHGGAGVQPDLLPGRGGWARAAGARTPSCRRCRDATATDSQSPDGAGRAALHRLRVRRPRATPSGPRVARSRSRCPATSGLVPGQPLRLARRRFDAVFPVRRGRRVAATATRPVWVAAPDGTAERRAVVVAERGDAGADQRRAAGGRPGHRRSARRADARRAHRARCRS